MIVSEQTDTQSVAGYLIPLGTEAEVSGAGPLYELGTLAACHILLVLRVAAAIEQESLHVSVWSSADGQDWGANPLFWFPQIFYTSMMPAALNLRERPEIKFLQARWEVKRWGRGDPRPYFKFSLEVQPLQAEPFSD